jgi:hypothetical protein
MNEKRFIELLNLYVDQQLTATEASELEGELQRNPKRRSTYQQYCRMQKACTILFEKERQTAPASSKLSRALADADRKVVAFPNRRSAWVQRAVFATGVAAMAACVALVFVRQGSLKAPALTRGANQATSSGTAVVATEAIATPAVQSVAIPPADPQTRPMRKFYAVLPVKQLIPLRIAAPAGERSAEGNPDFAWMKNVDMAPMRPVSADDLIIGTNTQADEMAETQFAAKRPGRSDIENTAFQFRKSN